MAKANKQLFIIDDDATHNDMLRQFLLDKFDVDIMSFTSGDDALRNIKMQPTYVLVDYYLDRINTGTSKGVDVLKQVRQMYPDTFVIVMSAQDKIEVTVDTLKYGAFDCVVKSPSGFLRIENNLNHINQVIRHRKTIKGYRNAALIFGGLLVLLIALIILFQQNGIT